MTPDPTPFPGATPRDLLAGVLDWQDRYPDDPRLPAVLVAAIRRTLTAADHPEAGHWWCPECRRPVDPVQVTFEEYHEACGTRVRWKDAPAVPDQPEARASAEAFVRAQFPRWHDWLVEPLTAAFADREAAGLRAFAARRPHFHATYHGGHEGDACRAFHHGMDTVFNALDTEVADRPDPGDGPPWGDGGMDRTAGE